MYLATLTVDSYTRHITGLVLARKEKILMVMCATCDEANVAKSIVVVVVADQHCEKYAAR